MRAGTSAAGWAEANVSRRPELDTREDGRRTAGPSAAWTSDGLSDEWRDASIGGEPARLRAACGFVDAVVVVNGRAYLFSMFTTRDGGGDTSAFEAVARTVRFEADAPESAPPSGSYTSDLYEYSIHLSDGWTVEPATTAWVPGALPGRSAAPTASGGPATTCGASGSPSALMPGGMSDAAWLHQYLPSRRHGDTGRCGGHSFMGLDPERWTSLPIDGLAGRVRSACGYVDAAVAIDGRVYVITAAGPFRYDGATPETQAAFDALIAAIDLPSATAETSPVAPTASPSLSASP